MTPGLELPHVIERSVSAADLWRVPDGALEVRSGAAQGRVVRQTLRQKGRNRGRQRTAGPVGVPARQTCPTKLEVAIGRARDVY